MRILFCNYEYPPLGGGGGVINALLAEELANRHQVTVLTSQGLGLPPDREENGVRVIRTPVFFRSRQAAANLASMLAYLPMGIRTGHRLLKEQTFDIVNTHFVLPTGPVGDNLSRHAGVPNILSVHGGDLFDPSKWLSPHRHWVLRKWVSRLLRRADRVVGQSRNTLQNVARFYAPEIPTDLIPLGIKRPDTDSASRSDYGLGADDVMLVTVGRLVARKAVDQLISIVGRLEKKNAHLLLIGSGPQETALREITQSLDLNEQVHFLGQVEEAEKFRILAMSDLYVSTSQHEGFGLVFLEAMACGLPVVCYDHGGQSDFLEDQRTGALLPLNDADSFIARCAELISDSALRSRIGEENRRRMESLYIDACAARYEALFEETIARDKRR